MPINDINTALEAFQIFYSMSSADIFDYVAVSVKHGDGTY